MNFKVIFLRKWIDYVNVRGRKGFEFVEVFGIVSLFRFWFILICSCNFVRVL